MLRTVSSASPTTSSTRRPSSVSYAQTLSTDALNATTKVFSAINVLKTTAMTSLRTRAINTTVSIVRILAICILFVMSAKVHQLNTIYICLLVDAMRIARHSTLTELYLNQMWVMVTASEQTVIRIRL